MMSYKITIRKQELITSKATFIIEGFNRKEIDLFLKDTTYEKIEEVIGEKLKWQIEDKDDYCGETVPDDIEEDE